MKENFLSQAEVDALLKKRDASEETGLRETDKDVIGEVGNITMSTAATTLSSIINRRVSITTPRVSYINFQEIIEECDIPKIVSRIGFKEGLKGNNLL
ncbi:MAG TPA: flagellar motor switch phosphatase FliY, partial [Clostridiaceae bacterium]|nr:flagellar motor switch phosphatase FliY [Clostridiaceae bacterium]